MKILPCENKTSNNRTLIIEADKVAAKPHSVEHQESVGCSCYWLTLEGSPVQGHVNTEKSPCVKHAINAGAVCLISILTGSQYRLAPTARQRAIS